MNQHSGIKEQHVQFIKKAGQYCNQIYDYEDLDLIHDRNTDADAKVIRQKNATYVVFRGTESIKDWMMNLCYRLTLLPIFNDNQDIKAHGGFTRQWQSIKSRVIEILKDHDNETPVVICGHSLGAACSLVASLELHKLGFNCINISFGGPRTFNYHAKSAFDKCEFDSYRITCGSDIITMVPYFGMHHVGHVGSHKSIHFNPNSLWFSVKDHSMETYASWTNSLEDHDILSQNV